MLMYMPPPNILLFYSLLAAALLLGSISFINELIRSWRTKPTPAPAPAAAPAAAPAPVLKLFSDEEKKESKSITENPAVKLQLSPQPPPPPPPLPPKSSAIDLKDYSSLFDTDEKKSPSSSIRYESKFIQTLYSNLEIFHSTIRMKYNNLFTLAILQEIKEPQDLKLDQNVVEQEEKQMYKYLRKKIFNESIDNSDIELTNYNSIETWIKQLQKSNIVKTYEINLDLRLFNTKLDVLKTMNLSEVENNSAEYLSEIYTNINSRKSIEDKAYYAIEFVMGVSFLILHVYFTRLYKIYIMRNSFLQDDEIMLLYRVSKYNKLYDLVIELKNVVDDIKTYKHKNNIDIVNKIENLARFDGILEEHLATRRKLEQMGWPLAIYRKRFVTLSKTIENIRVMSAHENKDPVIEQVNLAVNLCIDLINLVISNKTKFKDIFFCNSLQILDNEMITHDKTNQQILSMYFDFIIYIQSIFNVDKNDDSKFDETICYDNFYSKLNDEFKTLKSIKEEFNQKTLFFFAKKMNEDMLVVVLSKLNILTDVKRVEEVKRGGSVEREAKASAAGYWALFLVVLGLCAWPAVLYAEDEPEVAAGAAVVLAGGHFMAMAAGAARGPRAGAVLLLLLAAAAVVLPDRPAESSAASALATARRVLQKQYWPGGSVE